MAVDIRENPSDQMPEIDTMIHRNFVTVEIIRRLQDAVPAATDRPADLHTAYLRQVRILMLYRPHLPLPIELEGRPLQQACMLQAVHLR